MNTESSLEVFPWLCIIAVGSFFYLRYLLHLEGCADSSVIYQRMSINWRTEKRLELYMSLTNLLLGFSNCFHFSLPYQTALTSAHSVVNILWDSYLAANQCNVGILYLMQGLYKIEYFAIIFSKGMERSLIFFSFISLNSVVLKIHCCYLQSTSQIIGW